MLNSLVISVHDFRSLRKASVHFITGELAHRGPTRFFSIGLSRLSMRRGDTRANLADRSNRVERHEGVDCYLWKKAWHPFNMRRTQLAMVESALFRLYRLILPSVLRRWIREADIVFIESGLAAVFIADVKRINPAARIVYLASDDLEVVDCATTIKRDFAKSFDKIDLVRLPSRFLASGMPHTRSSVFIPHGIDRDMASKQYPDPYNGRPSAVSVGSMLFDASFFTEAAAQFPDIDFHVIGAGKAASSLARNNIIVHPELAFLETLGYLQHAAFGIAPYRDAETPRYLIDTSLKLRQFALFGIPAVCPYFALGTEPGRFGYTPGDVESIRHAIAAALANRSPIVDASFSWAQVVERILEPQAYPDTKL